MKRRAVLAQAELIRKQAAAIAALAARGQELVAQNATLTKRVEELEARLASPPKIPDNSPCRQVAGLKKPHKGAARALHPEPTRIAEARVEVYPHCAVSVAVVPVDQYDRIELREIVPRRTPGRGSWRDLPLLQEALQASKLAPQRP
ncbi:hypothetical protein [Mesorhizobium sp.]|uniref:hypothetical protein n=1 Tax=Mesorhizobium sp. TaxID=1871066 RepID=UPI00120283C3|nr:hypothetical protein [Mesorhizobium sp.]TIL44414.1 MAG: hypothetical protein E5Y86_16645 [Mesorhizobium sp.]